MSTSWLLLKSVLELLARATREEKEIEIIETNSEEVKISMCRDPCVKNPCVILHEVNPKHIIRKLLKLINQFKKATGDKINTQKLAVFLFTNIVFIERKTMKEIWFTIAAEIIFLGKNLTKEVRNSYSDNDKTLLRENTQKQKDIPSLSVD